MIVADATLIAYFAVRNEYSELADAVCQADGDWVAPELWRSEMRDVLAKYIQRARMTLESALRALQLAEEVVGGREYSVSSQLVLELAAESRCAAYRCEYAALAFDLGVKLVTSDKLILRAFPKIAVAPGQFVEKK